MAQPADATSPPTATPTPTPSLAELAAAGLRIGKVRVVTENIFDTADPQENKLLFRWANALHVQTRPGVIERALLFKPGETLSVQRLEETERLLRSNRYLYDVQFRVAAVRDGEVDIDVVTRDTWTLDPGFSASRTGGANSTAFGLREDNLLGTGISVSLGHSRNVDRSSNQFQIANERAFGTWTSWSYSHAANSDGRRQAASVVRPFYALDARWATGVTASADDRTDAVYNAGTVVSQYRRQTRQAEVFGGWSAGLVDGWVQRYSLGLSLQDDRFSPAAGLPTAANLPTDQRLVTPFVRYQRVEDRFERERNRNLIGRPEFFALGMASTVQLGRASTALGSSRDAWLYAASVSRGFEPAANDTLVAAAQLAGQYSDGAVNRQRLGAQLQYYRPQGRRWLLYASASADLLTRPDATDVLLLGGDNGLRGYPLRYQSGHRRALFTLEERFYTDLYPWRLFRIGGAAFVDAGRAWGGDNTLGANRTNPGWLGNVGLGLRIVNARSAFSNVLHVDLALPLNTTPGMKRLQFLVKTKTSF